MCQWWWDRPFLLIPQKNRVVLPVHLQAVLQCNSMCNMDDLGCLNLRDTQFNDNYVSFTSIVWTSWAQVIDKGIRVNVPAMPGSPQPAEQLLLKLWVWSLQWLKPHLTSSWQWMKNCEGFLLGVNMQKMSLIVWLVEVSYLSTSCTMRHVVT